jgi:hypothetical protein
VETGYWYDEKGSVFLCDQNGMRTGNKCEIPEGVDAKTVAIRLLKSATTPSTPEFAAPGH